MCTILLLSFLTIYISLVLLVISSRIYGRGHHFLAIEVSPCPQIRSCFHQLHSYTTLFLLSQKAQLSISFKCKETLDILNYLVIAEINTRSAPSILSSKLCVPPSNMCSILAIVLPHNHCRNKLSLRTFPYSLYLYRLEYTRGPSFS